MARSLYWKITLPFILLVFFGVGLLGVFMVNSSRVAQISNLRDHMVKEAQLSSEASLPSFLGQPGYESLDSLAKKMGQDVDARITFITKDGTVLGDTLEDPSAMENHADRPEVINALSSGVGESTRYSTTTRETRMYVAVPVVNQGMVLGVARISLPLTVKIY